LSCPAPGSPAAAPPLTTASPAPVRCRAQPGRTPVPSRFLYLVRHGEADDEGFLTEAGRQQATATGEHLRGVRFRAIRHSPLARAGPPGGRIGGFRPGGRLGRSGLLGDSPPPVDGPPPLPGAYASFLEGFTEDERADGTELASAALARYAVPGDTDSSELIVT